MEPWFEKCLAGLVADRVRFIVVGGLAVTLNGYVRLTEDIDIVVDLDPRNIDRLIGFLAKFGDGHGGEMTPADLDDEPGAIRIIEESESAQIDIFSQNGGYSYGDLAGGAETACVNGREFLYAAKSQLISIKSSSRREKDRIDISAMRQLIENPRAFD